MSKAQKIFVDTDEEIVFTIEHILANISDRVILIVPQNAALTSSAVSLKILSRRLLNINKFVVLVADHTSKSKIGQQADNKIGTTLGEKAGLIILSKISEVNKSVWEEAKRLKERLITEKNHIKEELLGKREVNVQGLDEDIKEDTNDVDKNNANDISGLSDLVVEPIEVAQKQKPLVKARIEDKPKVIPITAKPRLPIKIVEVNGIKLCAGGDIVEHQKRSKLDRLENISSLGLDSRRENNNKIGSDRRKSLNNAKHTGRKEEGESNDEVSEAFISDKERVVDDRLSDKAGLIGMDFRKAVSKKVPSRRRRHNNTKKMNFDKLAVIPNAIKSFFGFFGKGNNSMQILKYGLVGIVIFFIISYVFLPKVKVTLEFTEDKVGVNENISASESVDEVDVATLTIPAIKIAKTVSGSGEAEPSGEGSTGDSAKGLVDIHNNSDEDIVLQKNTVITKIGSQLKYKITKQVKISSEDKVIDVPIVAASFGENYNLTGNNRATFQIDGFTTDKVVAYAFRGITGGTTEDTITVSAEDLEALKATIEEDLKKELLEKLKELLSDEDRLLVGSETFSIVKYKVSAEEGDEVEKFTADMEMTVTALKITNADLNIVADEVVRLQEGSTSGANIDLSQVMIDDIVVIDGKVVFDIIFQADIQESLDLNQVKKQIAGQKISDARDYLYELEGVEDYRLKYTPSYIPLFLQKVPKDLEKIEIGSKE